MGDGLLGKCKDCTKKDTANRAAKKMNDPEWVEKELARHREKSARHRAEGRFPDMESLRVGNRKWAKANPHKKNAHRKVNQAIANGTLTRQPCEVCGDPKSEAHHEDYSRPLYVMWLCHKHHMDRHVELRRLERAANHAKPTQEQ